MNNPRPEGAQAVFRVLENQGFEVKETFSAAEAVAWMKADADRDATLIVIGPHRMAPIVDKEVSKFSRVVGFGIPHTSAASTFADLEEQTLPLVTDTVDAGPTSSQTAQIAHTVSLLHFHGVRPLVDAWETAFSAKGEGYEVATYVERTDNGKYRALSISPALLRNDTIALHGNAALAMNMVSAHSDVPIAERGPLIVYHPTLSDEELTYEPAAPTPEWLPSATALSFIAFVLFGLSRGMRLGRLVYEDTPSYVPSAETVAGRGRLTLANNQLAHIASQLRRDTARRLAQKIAVAPSSSEEALAAALISAGASAESVSWLWHPIPTSRDDLLTISARLTALEKEISS